MPVGIFLLPTFNSEPPDEGWCGKARRGNLTKQSCYGIDSQDPHGHALAQACAQGALRDKRGSQVGFSFFLFHFSFYILEYRTPINDF